MVEIFYVQGVSFVSITFNTTTSMEWLTLNVLLSCAQFEREVRGAHLEQVTGRHRTLPQSCSPSKQGAVVGQVPGRR